LCQLAKTTGALKRTEMIKRNFFKFLEGKRLGKSFAERAYVVRFFHPRGRYPRGVIAHEDALFCADEELVFSATLSTPWRVYDANAPYTEMDWLDPEELQFLGSILFTERQEEPTTRFYPVYRCTGRLPHKRLDLSNPAVVDRLRRSALIYAMHPPWHARGLSECLRLRYSLIEPGLLNLDRQSLYRQSIGPRDYVMLRGISALMKADMLACYPEFIEEAIISLFIALDASFQLILRKLASSGKPNPNAHDAAIWLFENFNEPLGFARPTVEKYFEDFYEKRVMTLHPASNKFGDHAYAPLMADDFFDTRDWLREILGYLACGSHGPDFHEAVSALR
jgi:hypothetical protein